MPSQIQTFSNDQFGIVRVISKDGDPWFVAKDVCDCLGLNDVSKTVSLLDDDERGTNTVRTPSGDQQMLIISEPGLYSLILRSRKPEAKAFKRWVTHEVLPSIRRDGGYMAAAPGESDEHLLARALVIANAALSRREKENAELAAKVDEAAPKVLFADAVDASNTSILVGELAKLLKQNGFDTGQNRLFSILRDEGFLMKEGASKNMPTQKSMELGLMEIKVRTIVNPDGSIRETKTPKVTGRGQIFFINRYCCPTE